MPTPPTVEIVPEPGFVLIVNFIPTWVATLRSRLAVEQVDSLSCTKRRTSALKRERDTKCPAVSHSLVQVRKGQVRRHHRRRRGQWRRNHLGLVRWGWNTVAGSARLTLRDGQHGGWACNPTRYPGIRTGTTHEVHRAGPATPARGAVLFSLSRYFVTNGNPPPSFSVRRHCSPIATIGQSSSGLLGFVKKRT